MGRLFLVEFDQTPHNHFYCCRICGAHIASSQDYNGRLGNLREGIFKEVFNVVADEPRLDVGIPIEQFFCVRCYKPLGWRSIQSSNPDGSKTYELALVWMNHLRFWNGIELLDADLPPEQLLPPPPVEVQQEVANQDQPPEEVEQEVLDQELPPEEVQEEVDQELPPDEVQEEIVDEQLPPEEVQQEVADQDLPQPPEDIDMDMD